MVGGGDVCAALLSLGEGEREGGGRQELEGERGSVGEKDRVPQESTSLSHTHIHTHSVTHTHLHRLPCCTFFLE